MNARDQVLVGARELDDFLKTLAPKMERNIMRTALRAGAAVVLPEVKSRIPSDTGQLRASARITTRYRKGQVSASVKVGNFVAWYAHLVEFGTRPHEIKPKTRDGAMRFGGTTTREVHHPGTRARPFMRPAADASFHAAIAAFDKRLRERLTIQGLNTQAPLPPDPEQ